MIVSSEYNKGGPPAGTSYVYDAENRLSYTSGYTYLYDGDGQRVAKCTTSGPSTTCPSGSAGTLFFRNSAGETFMERDVSGNLQNEYVFFNGSRLARVDSSHHKHYYFKNHLMSTEVVTGDTGSVEMDVDYTPYGSVQDGTPTEKYLFTGKERDTETGLDNFGARYFGSNMGRFMRPDPIMIMKQKLVDPQQWNMYSYARNNPLRFMDPTGMYATDCGSLGAKDCANRVKAADALQAKLAASKDPKDQAIAKALGTSKDTNNGVTLGFVKDFKDAKGNVISGKAGNTSGLFAAGQSTPDGKPVADIRIDIKGSVTGDQFNATLTHEGSHATERMDFVNSCSATGCSQSLNLTGRQSEQNAYGTEYRYWQSVGQGQQHPMISSPDQINRFVDQHPEAYPKSTIDNLLFPSDL